MIGLRGVSGGDCANTVGIQYSKVSNIQGSANVKEIFAETLVPLISDQSWMKSASLDVAGRWADYSGSGTIWAYKAGLDLAFSDAIRFRGTYSRDVRAANLSERFDKTGGAATVDDPRTPAVEAINVTIFSGGNPNVHPEKADTFTAGVVVQPDFIPGLSASVDWYKVDMKGAIGQVGTQTVVDNCLRDNLPEFCALITMQNDIPILVGNVYINIAQSGVEGVDAEISYRHDINLFGGGDESIAARAFGAWLISRTDSSQNGGLNLAGQTGFNQTTGVAWPYPDFKATGNITYRNGPFSAFIQGRYIAPGIQDATRTEGVDIEDNSVGSAFYTDLRLSYEFPVGDSSLEIFGTITNLFDKSPPVTPTYSAFLGYAGQVNTALYDVLGRRFTIGAKFKL
jgi:outer membrane receptor protein involved in Fe transport